MKIHIIISYYIPPTANHFLPICIQYDNNSINNFILYPTDKNPWHANRLFRKIWPSAQKKRSNPPMMHMNSEKPSRFSCLHYLVSIWLLQARCSVAPRQASAGSKPNSRPIASATILAPRNEAGAIAKTCPPTKRHNCLRLFSKRRVKAFPLWWLISGRRMNQQSTKESRLPQSTASWRGTAGVRYQQVGQTGIECKCHECLEQIFRSSLSLSQSSFCLGHPGRTTPGCHSCRPYLCATGGARCFSRIS